MTKMETGRMVVLSIFQIQIGLKIISRYGIYRLMDATNYMLTCQMIIGCL